MEEKLRNLSQNIANNTGPREADEPENNRENERFSDEETNNRGGDERIDTIEQSDATKDENDLREEIDEEVSDYAPEPVEDFDGPEEESVVEEEPADDGSVEEHESTQEVDERYEDGPEEPIAESDEAPETEPKSEDLQAEEHQEEAVDEKSVEKHEDHHEEQPVKAVILTMESDDEPKESSTRTQKYSPEVEAALSRLGSDEESSADISEPLSTEPHKKHHGTQIFLFILFILALAAICTCILVEQGIIENPFPSLFVKDEPVVVEPEPEPEPEPETQNYLDISEWEVKVVKPNNVNKFWYDFAPDDENIAYIYGTDSAHVGDETAPYQGANAVMSIIRSTQNSLQYSEQVTLSPVAAINNYYYYLVLIYGQPEDEIVATFQNELISNKESVLAR